MSEVNNNNVANMPEQGQSNTQDAASNSDQVPSNGDLAQNACHAGEKRARRERSTQGAAHYGNGHQEKKGDGVSTTTANGKPKVKCHNKKNDPAQFAQREFMLYVQFLYNVCNINTFA